MTKTIKKPIILADELIMNKIFIVRGLKVMIDRDLAELYAVEMFEYLRRKVIH